MELRKYYKDFDIDEVFGENEGGKIVDEIKVTRIILYTVNDTTIFIDCCNEKEAKDINLNSLNSLKDHIKFIDKNTEQYKREILIYLDQVEFIETREDFILKAEDFSVTLPEEEDDEIA
jgi:AAA+ ATPase superfamily predicted ATPase